MSSNILHKMPRHSLNPAKAVKATKSIKAAKTVKPSAAAPLTLPKPDAAGKHPFLEALGERVRNLRARQGMTRKAAALAADVSERHWANLEYGVGNASIMVLLQVAGALHCSLAELVGDVTTSSPEWLMLRALLEHRDDATLRRARVAVGEIGRAHV